MEDFRKVSDPVRPGEQWFCYWKTSASLWESRILEFDQHEIIFIPIYWGFHAEAGGVWDFGKLHPERDFVRLLSILTQHGRRFCWLLPLTPAPFLPNGGLPTAAARTLSISDQGVNLACLDQDGTLHKMYSFFEPKVFQNFVSFVQSFGEMISQLSTTGVRVPTGFATTSLAFRDFLEHNNLTERIQKRLENLNIDDVRALAEAGKEIRNGFDGWMGGQGRRSGPDDSCCHSSAKHGAVAGGFDDRGRWTDTIRNHGSVYLCWWSGSGPSDRSRSGYRN